MSNLRIPRLKIKITDGKFTLCQSMCSFFVGDTLSKIDLARVHVLFCIVFLGFENSSKTSHEHVSMVSNLEDKKKTKKIT